MGESRRCPPTRPQQPTRSCDSPSQCCATLPSAVRPFPDAVWPRRSFGCSSCLVFFLILLSNIVAVCSFFRFSFALGATQYCVNGSCPTSLNDVLVLCKRSVQTPAATCRFSTSFRVSSRSSQPAHHQKERKQRNGEQSAVPVLLPQQLLCLVRHQIPAHPSPRLALCLPRQLVLCCCWPRTTKGPVSFPLYLLRIQWRRD